MDTKKRKKDNKAVHDAYLGQKWTNLEDIVRFIGNKPSRSKEKWKECRYIDVTSDNNL